MPAPPEQPRRRTAPWNPRRLAAGCLILALTVLVYLPSLRNGFIWDDDHYVTGNLELRTPAGLAAIWFTPGSAGHLYQQYYPLVHTTYWLEYHLWQLNPLGYHLVNVLLHALGAVLLWRVLERLQVPGAWFAAAVFAVHPVQVESVAWITERKNVLSGVFYLGAALTWLRFAGLDAQRPEAAGRWRWYWAALGLFACALLSKTVACTLPAAALLVVWWKRGRVRWRDAGLMAPFFALGLMTGLTTVWLERTVVGAAGAEWALTPVERGLIAARALWFYAGKLAWPTRLTFTYPRWDIDAGLWWQWMFVAAGLGVALALWLARRRLRAALVAVLFFVVTLGPALGFINVYPMRYSFVADHFQYLASAGLIALAAAAGAAIVRGSHALAAAALAAATLGLLGSLSWRQQHVYESQDTLWRDTLAKNPESWLAHNNLGMSLARQDRFQEAIGHFEQALRFNPQSDLVYANLGTAELRTRRVDEAIAHLERALAINPLSAEAHCNFGNALMVKGKPAEAIAHFEQAVRLQPDFADAHFNLAVALMNAGEPAAAIRHFQQALRFKPDFPPVLDRFAWLLATTSSPALRDGAQAVRLAEQACQLTGRRQASYLATLAAAYAEAGRLDEAVATGQQALALASTARQDTLAAAIAAQVDVYRSGRAFRAVSAAPEAAPTGR